MEILCKIYEEKNINWVEAVPQTLDRHHDVPILSGLSPYQIVLGGTNHLGMCLLPPRLSVRMLEISLPA